MASSGRRQDACDIPLGLRMGPIEIGTVLAFNAVSPLRLQGASHGRYDVFI
jgi:hypothetical protein